MLEEGGIVRPRAERAERQVAPAFRRVDHVGRIAVGAEIGAGEDRGAAALRRRDAGPGIGDIARRLVDEMLKLMAAGGEEEAAAVGVGVDIEERLLLQLGGVGLGPFGRAQEARLLAVPARVDDGPRRPPARAVERAQRLGLAHQRDLAGQRVGRAEHPAVMVVAADDPLVGIGRSAQHADRTPTVEVRRRPRSRRGPAVTFPARPTPPDRHRPTGRA